MSIDRERETLPPPAPDEDETRDVRRAAYLVGGAEEALRAIEDALARSRTAALGATAYHLGLAWDDGAAREADLRTAIGVLRSEVRAYREESAGLLGMLESIHTIAQQQQAEIGRLREEVAELRAELERRPRPTEDTAPPRR
jgi:hypothetical protein